MINPREGPLEENQEETFDELQKIEIQLLLEGIYQQYGYDFRDYVFPSIRRRILHRLRTSTLPTVSALQDKVLHDPKEMAKLITDFSISVTEMFRDPGFFLAIKQQVIPLLREIPHIKIWHAGCSTGEEVYSMAIFLHEEGLHEKATIYATDMNESLLETAKKGKVPLEKMRDYTRNYHLAGGTRAFSEYYTAKNDGVFFCPELLENIVFAQHNLVTDRSFNEFHLIICRNVLIYFNRVLQSRVQRLFYESLAPGGFLGMGNKEGLVLTGSADFYEIVDKNEKIYRKKTI